MRIFAFTLLLVTASSYAQDRPRILGFTFPEGMTRVKIPVEIHNNLIVLPVVVNNQMPLKFILDTGVRTAILTEKSYSDILRLPYFRQLTISGPGAQRLITAYIANDVSLALPAGIKANGQSLLVLEKDYLELRNFLGAEVQGVLGYELFSRFVVLIDYQNKYIELIEPGSFKPSRKFQALPITLEDTKPFLRTSVGLQKKKTLKLLMDTGASHGMMLDPQSDSDIQVPVKNVASVIGRALGGEITGRIARVASVELGKYTLDNVVTNFPDPNSYMDTLKASMVVRNGSLGGEVFTRFTVIFDYSNERIYLQKNSAFKKEFQTNLSGITVKAKGARLKTFEVVDVRQKSVSDRAEIKEGDLIESVNGSSADSYSLREINGILSSKPGKRVTLGIIRGGEKLRKTITLEQEI